jgi:RNA polymerase sigma factor (TIGR02999 family)
VPVQGPPPVTELLRAWSAGNEAALGQLIPLLEAELRRLARIHMARERLHHTLQATALVNEAFVRLIDARQVGWQDRAHFLGIASRLMRRVLVDHARARSMQKRGGGGYAVPLEDDMAVTPAQDLDLLALDRALDGLAAVDARKVQVIEMRFFGGMTVEETASALRVSTDTVKRDWRLARLWLLREIEGTPRD